MQLLFLNESGLKYEDLLGMSPRKPAAVCELFLIGHSQCGVRWGVENMLDCVARFGWDAWTQVLQPQCTESVFWQQTVRRIAAQRQVQNLDRLRMDPVVESHWGRERASSSRDEGERPRVPPWTYATPHPALNCSFGKIFPLGFCVPEHMFLSHDSLSARHLSTIESDARLADIPLFPKVFEWFPSLPSPFPARRTGLAEAGLLLLSGKTKKKKYAASKHDEYVVRMVHHLSMFSWTHTRGGPDSMRHHEILSAGGVPYYPELRALPPERVSMLPRGVLQELVDGPLLPSLLGVAHIGAAPAVPGRNSPQKDSPFFARYDDDGSSHHSFVGKMAVAAASMLTGPDPDPHSGELFFHINFKRLGTVDWTLFDVDAYMATATKLLGYTKRHLGCRSVAAHLLKVMDAEKPRKLMYVGTPEIDYMSVMIEMGLSELRVPYVVPQLGEHHRPPGGYTGPRTGKAYADWLRNDTADFYGLGFGTSRRLDAPPVDDDPCQSLRNGEYDVWIWSHPWPKMTQRSSASLALRAVASLFTSRLGSPGAQQTAAGGGGDQYPKGGTRPQTFLCFDDVVRLVKRGDVKAAFVDGGDGPSSPGYPGLTRNGITVFAREPVC